MKKSKICCLIKFDQNETNLPLSKRAVDQVFETAKKDFISKTLLQKGQKYIVVKAFGTLCCKYNMEEGWLLSILKQTSPNRVYILCEKGKSDFIHSIHKVKISTLLRSCNLIQG